MLQTAVIDKIRTHFVFNNFFSEGSAFYEVTWKNVLEPDRPHMTI